MLANYRHTVQIWSYAWLAFFSLYLNQRVYCQSQATPLITLPAINTANRYCDCFVSPCFTKVEHVILGIPAEGEFEN